MPSLGVRKRIKVAISYGQNGLAFGVTAGGNYGKGYGNGDEQSFRGSRIGDKHSQTTIHSQADTNIKGSQVSGEKVNLKAQNLNIESLQDTMTYKGKQQNMQAQVTIGYGFSASGSFNRSKVNADYASVTTQAGIFAGGEGYNIEVDKHTDLKGAIITSTEQAETDGKNSLATDTLSYSHIENRSSHSASGIGISGSVAMNFNTPLGDKGIAQSNKQAVNDDGQKLYVNAQGEQTTNAVGQDGKQNTAVLAHWLDSLTGNVSMGFGSDKQNQHSQTKSGINTANITIRNEDAQLEKTGKTVAETLVGIKTETTTENAQENSGKLENRFDKEKVMKEIQVQVSATKDFLDNAQETKDKIIDSYQEPKRKALRQAITDWHNAKQEDKEQYKDKVDELIQEIYALEHIRTGLDLATGLLVGAPKVMSASTLLSVLDTEARRETLNNSLLAPPIEDANDKGKLYSNVGHNSGAFDGIKLGGVRMNYGVICGKNNERCETDEKGKLKLNERGHVVYRGDKEKIEYSKISELLKNEEIAKRLIGATGGFQATAGTFFGLSYKPGSFLDKGVEGYAGQHDLVGGQWLFYDKDGNGDRNLTDKQQFWVDRYSESAVVFLTPTVLPNILPLEVKFLLFGVR